MPTAWAITLQSNTTISSSTYFTTGSTAAAPIQWWGTGTGTASTTPLYTGGYRIPVTWANYPQPVETEEQRAASIAAAAERQRERKEAAARARQLLDGSLDAQQRADWREHRRFRVLSADGERTYEIRDSGQVQNVHRVDEHGKSVRRYCIHPTEPVPDADAYLAQKLWIETDEAAFLRVANAS